MQSPNNLNEIRLQISANLNLLLDSNKVCSVAKCEEYQYNSNSLSVLQHSGSPRLLTPLSQ